MDGSMEVSRRSALIGGGALSASLAVAAPLAASPSPNPRDDFPFAGTYLNAAFIHPLPRAGQLAAEAFARERLADPASVGPRVNPRDGAVARFARLVGVAPADIAVVPSTMSGENLLIAALGLGPGAGVVTDALHYDGSLALYRELARGGVPVAVVRPRVGRIDLADVRAALGPGVRLVAVSLVSSDTGFEYDLQALCELAHAHGALVYADIIQAAGAVPIDLEASGVDFACGGAYKWLMGEFGAAFLYVRPDRLDRLKRVQVGWRQLRSHAGHVLPFDSPGPVIGDYQLADGAAGLFEVGSPAWNTLAVTAASLDYLAGWGVEAIMARRRPLTDRLQARLPQLGLIPLTPAGSRSPVVAFACRDADKRFADRLKAAGIRISLYPDRMRIAPSVYNTLDEVDHLASVLAA
jgi:selenocysteine lyase/cysteine desulfurase